MSKEFIVDSFKQISTNFLMLQECADVINEIASVIIDALEEGNKIIFCGNGGSASDSQHLAAELMCKYKMDRTPLAAISLTTDTSAITAISNDYGFEQIFSRQIKGIGEKGDVIICISTSGKSKNILDAIKTANDMGIRTVLFTGENFEDTTVTPDIILNVPSSITNNIQEMHIAVGHILCDLVEQHFFSNEK